MIDIKALQNSFDEIAKKLQKKKIDESLLKSLKELSFELKEKKAILETLSRTKCKEQTISRLSKRGKRYRFFKSRAQRK